MVISAVKLGWLLLYYGRFTILPWDYKPLSYAKCHYLQVSSVIPKRKLYSFLCKQSFDDIEVIKRNTNRNKTRSMSLHILNVGLFSVYRTMNRNNVNHRLYQAA